MAVSMGVRTLPSSHGARVVAICEGGYGAALSGGIKAAQGRYVIMGDAMIVTTSPIWIDLLRNCEQGYELVMGCRSRAEIKQGATSPLHRYLGNPVLTCVGRLFLGSPVSDFHCGLRGFDEARSRGWTFKPPAWNLPLRWS